MVIPVLQWGTLFNAASASSTIVLGSTALGQAKFARSIILEVNGGSTPDWTLDIQGKASDDATWHNVDYMRIDQGSPGALSVAQLAVNWTTARYYVVPNPPPFMRLVGTRTGGTLTVYGAHSSEAYSNMSVAVDTELPAAAALADATANPTAPAVGAHVLAWNGTTWDRARFAPPSAATFTANVGMPMVSTMGYAASNNYTPQYATGALADGNTGYSSMAIGLVGFNGTTFDRIRSRGTGILQVETAFSFLNIAAGQATTTVKSGAGTLRAIVFNGPATATSTLVVYDNTAASGTVIARPLATAVVSPVSVTYDLAFGTGLTLITAVANGADMTVVYR